MLHAKLHLICLRLRFGGETLTFCSARDLYPAEKAEFVRLFRAMNRTEVTQGPFALVVKLKPVCSVHELWGKMVNEDWMCEIKYQLTKDGEKKKV